MATREEAERAVSGTCAPTGTHGPISMVQTTAAIKVNKQLLFSLVVITREKHNFCKVLSMLNTR